jgi:hypothetical protein
VRAALADTDPIARAAALVAVLRDLEPSELDEVEQAYRASFVGGPQETSIVLLSEAWGAFDPAGALDRTSTWPEVARLAARKAVLRAWGRRNPNAAMEWAEGIDDDGTAVETVFAGWAESGDPAMWDHVAKMEPSMQRESASIAIMQRVIAQDGFDGLFARVEALPDEPPSFKRSAIATATGLVADHDPARAIVFADRYAGTPNGRGLLRRVAVRWVRQDGQAAMQYLLDRPASTDRDWALRQTYITWLRRSRQAALDWMPESAAADPRFTPIVDIYAVAIAKGDPEHPGDAVQRAIRWVEPTPDPAKRRESLVLLGVIWLYYEPEAASVWLAANGLEADVRAETSRRDQMSRAASPAQRKRAAGPPTGR